MTDGSSSPPAHLSYATPQRRGRISRLVLLCFISSLLAPPAAFALVTSLEHDQVCPGCGGWAAGAAVAMAGVLLFGSGWALVRAIRLGPTLATVILGSISLAAGALFLLAAVGFYFAIQA